MVALAPALNVLLTATLIHQASDLHLCAGGAPRIRLHGALLPLHTLGDANGSDDAIHVLSDASLRQMLDGLMNQEQQAQLEQGQEVDFAFAHPTLGRFRVNAFLQLRGCGAVMRRIPISIPTLDALHTPPVLLSLLHQVGLLLITGPTGSGKSTTLAAMVQHLNTSTEQHIVTLENPIEFVHISDRCLITQREMAAHSQDFTHALRAALREDPDVILVGELRDLETIRLALTAAETGHLVLASVHTRNASATIDRIVDVFDAHEKAWVRTQLSESLIGVVSQSLCRTPTQDGRTAIFETLVATPAIRHLVREGKSAQMYNAMQTGASHGMQTMAQAEKAARDQGRIA